MLIALQALLNPAAAGTAPPLNWRRFVPSPLKMLIRRSLTLAKDLRQELAGPGPAPDMPHFMEIAQPIVHNAWLESKVENFRLASQQVNAVIIRPGQVFSFWKIVGKPTAAKGYQKGRNIVAGKVQETYGGGLCQVSGILYHTALLAGLRIVERHNHSVDLYANGEPRFTPLGADATVAFGYKDLRLANPFDFDLRFELRVVDGYLACSLFSERPITAQVIDFQHEMKEDKIVVKTLRKGGGGEWSEIEKSCYGLA